MDYSTIKVMKTLRIVYLFVIAALFAACSSTDDAVTDNPSGPTGSKTYTMTISANKHGDTRALTLDGNTLNSSWKKGEQVKVVEYNVMSGPLGELGTLTAQSDGVSTTLTGAITEPTVGNFLQLVFPRFPNNKYDYAGQKGTLDDIAANFDYATGGITEWDITDGYITTESPVSFSNATQAIVKFNLQNSDGTPINASSLTIHDENGCIIQSTNGLSVANYGDLTINLDEPSSEVWVAISSNYFDVSSLSYKTSNLTLTATVGSYNYTYTKSDVTFTPGKYYSITVKMNPVKIEDPSTPLTLEAIEDGTITFNNKASGVVTYNVNNGSSQTIAASSTVNISVSAGDIVAFYGDNRQYKTSNINCTADCYLYGNIMSLLSSTNYETLKRITFSDTFIGLFSNNNHIINHNHKKFLLPATTIAGSCYERMFEGCTSLKEAPELPALSVESYSYRYMFSGCTSLKEAPKLPATTLALNCYAYMFLKCTSLKKAPELPAETLAHACYSCMFCKCSSLESAPILPATVMAEECYYAMFDQCTSLTSAPELPATTLSADCYYGMFGSCTNLTSAPALPATTLASSCYSRMFVNCTSLTSAPALAATTLASGCYSSMFYDCTSLSSAPALPATTLASGCYSSMFYDCTSLTSAPALPATTLAISCYSSMFYNCTSLTSAPALPATTLANYCYRSMFEGCTNLTSAPALPATTLANYCYSEMFSGCTGLTSPPSISATTLADYCCSKMFYNCNSLTSPPNLPATELAQYCYSEMFSGCNSLTSAPNLPASTIAVRCYNKMFYNCSKMTSSPSLPATTLDTGCYCQMFYGCKELTTAPELPAVTLTNACYYQMFYTCSKLNRIKCLATNISATNCLSSWVYGVSSTGTFIKASAMNSWTTGTSGIPTKWTTVNATE